MCRRSMVSKAHHCLLRRAASFSTHASPLRLRQKDDRIDSTCFLHQVDSCAVAVENVRHCRSIRMSGRPTCMFSLGSLCAESFSSFSGSLHALNGSCKPACVGLLVQDFLQSIPQAVQNRGMKELWNQFRVLLDFEERVLRRVTA